MGETKLIKKILKILKVTGRKKTKVNSWAISYNLY